MTMRSNADGDIISFQYYDASEDVVLVIQETELFTINASLIYLNCFKGCKGMIFLIRKGLAFLINSQT